MANNRNYISLDPRADIAKVCTATARLSEAIYLIIC